MSSTWGLVRDFASLRGKAGQGIHPPEPATHATITCRQSVRILQDRWALRKWTIQAMTQDRNLGGRCRGGTVTGTEHMGASHPCSCMPLNIDPLVWPHAHPPDTAAMEMPSLHLQTGHYRGNGPIHHRAELHSDSHTLGVPPIVKKQNLGVTSSNVFTYLLLRDSCVTG